MKTLRVQLKELRDENFLVKSVKDVDTGIEVNSPSTLLNLLRIRKALRTDFLGKLGFIYQFPSALSSGTKNNGFKIDFPIIFE